MVVLFALIENTLACEEKIVIFSRSIPTLGTTFVSQFSNSIDFIENRLQTAQHRVYRIDGSVPATKRNKLVTQFNRQKNKVRIFLCSTRVCSSVSALVLHFSRLLGLGYLLLQQIV